MTGGGAMEFGLFHEFQDTSEAEAFFGHHGPGHPTRSHCATSKRHVSSGLVVRP